MCYKYKMSAQLSIDWIKQNLGFNTVYGDYEPVVATDASGNIYVAFTTNGTVSGGSRLTANDSFNVIAIAKLDSTGNVMWIKEYTQMQSVSSSSNVPLIDTDSQGNLYITYQTSAAVSGGTYYGNSDIVVAKLDTNGALQWIVQNPVMNSLFGDIPCSIKVVKSTGTIYISYIVGGATSGNTYMGLQDIAITKMLTDGTIVWVRQPASLNTSDADGGNGYTMTINANEDILLSYIAKGVVSGGSYLANGDVVFVRMNSIGDIVWIKQLPSLNSTAVQNYPYIVADNDYMYALYQTNSAVSGGTFTGATTDAVLVKLSVVDGSTIYVKENNTFNRAYPSINLPLSLQFSSDGNLVSLINISNIATIPIIPNTLMFCKFNSNTGEVLGLTTNAMMSSLYGTGQMYGQRSNPILAVDNQGGYIFTYYTNTTTSGNTNIGELYSGTLSDIVVFKASAGSVQWTKQDVSLSTNTTDTNPVLKTDASGNIYIAYETSGTVSGGGGKPGGTNNIVYAKLTPDGSVAWIFQNSNLNRNQLTTFTSNMPNLVVDSATGMMYISYYVTGTVSGAGNMNPSGATSGNYDIVIAKIATNTGTIQWIKQNSTFNTIASDPSQNSRPVGMAITADGLYCTYTVSAATSGNSYSNSQDICVFRMNTTTGSVDWIRQNAVMNTPGSEFVPAIAADSTGNVFIAYSGSSAVSGGTVLGVNDSIVMKMNSLGAIQWIKQNNTFNSIYLDLNPSIAVNSSDEIIIAAHTAGTISGGTFTGTVSSGRDIYVWKMNNSTGATIWSNQTPLLNSVANEANVTVACDFSNNIYLSYETAGTVSGGVSAGGTNDIVVAKLDTNGTVLEVKQYPALNSSGAETRGFITIDASGSVVGTYITTGDIPGKSNVSRMRNDIVVGKAREILPTSGPLVAPTVVRTGTAVSLSYTGSDAGTFPITYYKSVGGVKTALSGSVDTLTTNVPTSYYAAFSAWGSSAYYSPESNTVEYLSAPSIGITGVSARYPPYTSTLALTVASPDATSYLLTNSAGLSVTLLPSQFPYEDTITDVKTISTTLYYSIKALNSYGSSITNQSATLNTNSYNTPPQDPPIVTRNGASVTLSNTISLAAGDAVYYTKKVGNTYTILLGSTDTLTRGVATTYYVGLCNPGRTQIGLSSTGTTVEYPNNPAISLSYNASTRRMTVNLDTAVSDATSYTLTGTSGISVSNLTTGSFPYTDSTILTPATSYTYTLQAFNSYGSSDIISASKTTNPASPASAPTATRTNGDVALSYSGNDIPTGGSVLYYVSTNGITYTSLGAGVTADTIAVSATRYYKCSFVVSGLESATLSSSTSVSRASILIQAFSSKAGIYFSISNVPEGVTSVVISRDGSANPTIATLAAPIASSYEDTNVVLGSTYTYTFTVHNTDNTTTTVPVTATWSISSHVIIPYGEVVIKAVSRTVDGLIQITYNSDIAGFYPLLFGDGTWVDTTCEVLLEVGNAKIAIIASSDQLDDGVYKIANTVVEADDNIIFEIATIDTNMVIPPVIVPYTGPSYVYPLYNIKTTVEGDRVAIVSPFKADYTGTTTASIGVISMSDQQFYTGIDAVFEYTLTEEDAVRLLNTFNVRDTNVFPSPLYAVGQPGYTDEQDSLHFEVDLANKPVFMDVLRSIMAQAGQTTGKQLSNIKAYFEEEMRVELNLQLQQSGLLDMLEASNVSDVAVDLDISGGAYSMAETIDASGSHANLKRKQFLTQIPMGTLRSYMAEAQPFIGFLPLRGADSMTFVFDVNVDSPSELTAKSDGSGASYVDPSVVPSIHFANERRQVAFVFHLTNRKSMFCPDVESVDAHMTDAILARFPDASGSGFTVDDVFYAARDFFDLSPYVLRANYTAADIARLDAAAAQPALTDATTPAEKRTVGLARFKASAALEYKTQRDQAVLVNTGIESIVTQGANSTSVATAPLTVTYTNNRITVSTPDLSTIRLAPLYYYMVGDIEGTGPWQTMIPLTWAGTSLYADNVVFGSYGGFKIFGYFEPRTEPVMAPWMGPDNAEVWTMGAAYDDTPYIVYRSELEHFIYDYYTHNVVDSLQKLVANDIIIPMSLPTTVTILAAGFDGNQIWLQATVPGDTTFELWDSNNMFTASYGGFGGMVIGQYTLLTPPTNPYTPGTYTVVNGVDRSIIYAYITFTSVPGDITVSTTPPA